MSIDENGDTRRVYMARPGPFTIILALAVLVLIAVLMLIVLLSVAVIWIPVVIVLIAAFVLSMYWRRFRSLAGAALTSAAAAFFSIIS